MDYTTDDEETFVEDEGLISACKDGNSAIVSRLVEVPGRDINYQDENGDTAAHVARTECVKILAETGTVDWSKGNKTGETPPDLGNVECVERLDCWNGDTPIMRALKGGQTKVVEILLRCPWVDVNFRDKEGWSLVFRAIQRNERGEKMLKFFVY